MALFSDQPICSFFFSSAPDHFDPTTIARHLGDNWALKASNLRKLIRNLEYYYHEDLKKDANFAECTESLSSIARTADPDAIASLVELVAAAAVTCEQKGEFVGRIMGMTQTSQIQMKGIIQSSLARLEDYDGGDDEGVDNEMVFAEAESKDKNDEDAVLFEANHLKSNGASDADKEELERALLDARRELAQQKSQSTEMREDNDKAQNKLRALVEDLQDRLAQRQDELITAEEELRAATNELDEVKSQLHEVEETKAQLADELDVSSAKAMQLHKAEATVMAYKKKLESVGMVNQQMTDLEDQAAGYLRQIMDLESEAKKAAALQKQVEKLQEKVATLEKDRNESSDAVKSTSTDIAGLKSRLAAAEGAKKMFEEELNELRAQQSVEHEEIVGVQGLDISTNGAADNEKTMRLQIENKKLREELEELKKGGAVAGAVALASTAAATGDATAMSAEVQQLKLQLAKKEADNKKIGSDKDKLEAYTKRTLAKFQDKYLVALQECKAKLKEKQDKIEILESRSATEKTAQKREERLLSSTIFELGLAIMQNRLKER
jgi:protein HOOK3